MHQKFIQRFKTAVQVSQQESKPTLILGGLTNDVDLDSDQHACALCLVKPRNMMLLAR